MRKLMFMAGFGGGFALATLLSMKWLWHLFYLAAIVVILVKTLG